MLISSGLFLSDGVGGFVRHHVVKRSLQGPLLDQILSYLSTLDLCVREISSIKFFGVSVTKEWSMFVLTWRIALQSQRPCLEQEAATFCPNTLQQNCSHTRK